MNDTTAAPKSRRMRAVHFLARGSVARCSVLTCLAAALVGCRDSTGTPDPPEQFAYEVRPIFQGTLATVRGNLLYPPARPMASLNETGQAAFTSADGEAILWNGTSLITLGAGEAWDINDEGQIAGAIGNDAVVWDAEHTPRVVYSGGSHARARAVAINSTGQVAAQWESTEYCGPGSRCATRVLRLAGDSSEVVSTKVATPTAMNDEGWITGWHDPDHYYHPFVIRDTAFAELPWMGSYQYTWDINTRGDVVGSGDGSSAAYWPAGGGVTWLPGGGENSAPVAMGINDAGAIVGTMYVPPDSTARPPLRGALWRNGEIQILDDLIPPRWTISTAIDINEQGQILAAGVDLDTQEPVVVLLSPTRSGSEQYVRSDSPGGR